MESRVSGVVVGGRGRGGGECPSLPLPPPPRLAALSSSSTAAATSSASSAAAAASIRAHLARTASGVDCQASPRSLLSRILLRGGGGGGDGGGFGCRVRLPRRYGGGGGGGREGKKDGASDQGETPRVKIVEPPAPELPAVETARSSTSLLGRKKPEEELVSMNLGLGASLVLLLSKSAVELNKMVELRAQMEALVSEIRQAARRKETENLFAGGSAPACSQESNGSSSAATTAVKDPIAFPGAGADADAASNSSRTADNAPAAGRAVVVMDRMEAELQAELSRMQRGAVQGHGDTRVSPVQGLEVVHLHVPCTIRGTQCTLADGVSAIVAVDQLPPLKVKTKGSAVPDSPSRSCVDDGNAAEEAEEDEDEYEEAEEEESSEEEEEEEEYEEERTRSPAHGGVSARALERRLHELLQKRQQERIVELEAALDSAQRRLHEKEREVVWWRDAAKLVSHRRDESSSACSRRLVR
ncbi:hypothetical protein ACP4OV_017616 [Aristida adscensionis]